MKKRLLITMTALMFVAMTMMAVPAKPGVKKIVTLKNGSTVELTLRGDEHFSFYTDAEGKPCQVVNGQLKMMAQDEASKIWKARRAERLEKIEQIAPHRASGVSRRATEGIKKGIVILVEFTDAKFTIENPQSAYTRFFNEEGYNEGGMAGSVRDYFLRQSYEKLQIDFDVFGPYTLSREMAYYGKPIKKLNEKGEWEIETNDTIPDVMIREAVDAAEKDGVNFSKYSWYNNKIVDQVFVIYAGYAQAQGADENTIWPHRWALWNNKRDLRIAYDGCTINNYACAAELKGDGKNNTGHMDGIGTACHEFGHCLGLPDMYDTKGDNFGMSYWDVMDQGSYNDDSRTPAGYTSYERWFSGWLTPTEIKETRRVTDMKPIATNKEAYVLYNDKNKDEYYLLENRQPVGFDAKLPGHGLLILHVDYNGDAWRGNTVNVDANHQRVTIIPADNELTTGRGGLAGDPWPGTTMNTMLGRYTTPAATLYNENTDGSKLMSKLIDDISENTETQTVSFAVGRTEMIPPSSEETTVQASKNSFTITWPEVSGATGYEVELKTVGRSPDNVEEALIYKADFSKCYTNKSIDITSTSTLKQYGLSGWQGQELYTSPKGFMIGSSGYAFSKHLTVPESSNVTVVVGADKVDNDVDYQIMLYYWPDPNSNDYSTGVSYNYTVTKDSKQVFHFTNINAYSFCFLIYPFQPMYLNYWAIYDGIWTAEQLGISSSSAAPRRASTTDIYETKTNSKTFDNMDADKLYIYRIRAKGPDNAYSGWTAEQTFDFKTTGIQSISTKVNNDNIVRYFDLQGREVNDATKGLLIRKQGNNVTKVMVK